MASVFGLPPDIVGAALGGLGVEEVYGLESKVSIIFVPQGFLFIILLA